MERSWSSKDLAMKTTKTVDGATAVTRQDLVLNATSTYGVREDCSMHTLAAVSKHVFVPRVPIGLAGNVYFMNMLFQSVTTEQIDHYFDRGSGSGLPRRPRD